MLCFIWEQNKCHLYVCAYKELSRVNDWVQIHLVSLDKEAMQVFAVI